MHKTISYTFPFNNEFFLFKLETGQLYQRVNRILTSQPYGLSLIVPAFMMTEEVIQILIIKLLFSCKCS